MHMTKLNKRAVDSLSPLPDRDVFDWDGEVRGFGVRVKPSGVKTYFIQYRNADGRTRRMVIGKHGILTTDEARDLARQRLGEVLKGEDPSAKRRAARSGMTVSDICDWYLTEARAGRLLGRNRRPIKPSTLDGDEGRINVHIKPLLGGQSIRGIILPDIEKLQAKIARGRSMAGSKRRDRGGQTKGGAGVASRTVSTLRSMLGHAKRFGLIETNPALGVRVIASNKKVRRLSREELARFGGIMDRMEEKGEHPTGLAAIRTMLLTGFRKMEVLGMQRSWIHAQEHSVWFPDTKAGQQVRVIGRNACDLLVGQPARDNSPFVFPADWDDGHFVGVVRVLDRICAQAKIDDVTPHVLRHTFASIAAELGLSELTIAGLLGHASRGVTQRYVHFDTALVSAANRVAAEIALLVTPRVSVSQRTAAQ
jgi:integrase